MKMKNLGFLVFMFLFPTLSVASEWQSGISGGERLAHIRFCNPMAQSYCEKSSVYGEGYGLIVFENQSQGIFRLPLRPGGRNSIEASMMAGKLQAIITIYARKYRDHKVVD